MNPNKSPAPSFTRLVSFSVGREFSLCSVGNLCPLDHGELCMKEIQRTVKTIQAWAGSRLLLFTSRMKLFSGTVLQRHCGVNISAETISWWIDWHKRIINNNFADQLIYQPEIPNIHLFQLLNCEDVLLFLSFILL